MEEWPVIPRVKYPLADNGNFCIVKATGVAHICADAGQAGAGILVFRCTHVDGSPFLPEPPHHAYMVDVVMIYNLALVCKTVQCHLDGYNRIIPCSLIQKINKGFDIFKWIG